VARGTFSPARAWRPAAVVRLARTLCLRKAGQNRHRSLISSTAMEVRSRRVGGVGRMLSLNAEENAHQVVPGLAAHRIAVSEPSCSSGPPRWQRSGKRAAVLRGGLKASCSGVLVYRQGADSVRWAGRPGAGWLTYGLSKAAVCALRQQQSGTAGARLVARSRENAPCAKVLADA
jgi:hypothetical protein